ncbi:MAG: [protein-PII] uridylyltransferase [Deltaproteobacteria bacterium]|nr:[protein-PII] uridylyltransferase [Deltaproteobacteria bacterium]
MKVDEFKEQRQAIADGINAEGPSLEAIDKYCELIDRFIGELLDTAMDSKPGLKELMGDDWAVLALGGYGRREMNLASDVDILFLFKNRVSDKTGKIIKEVLYPLWDTGLEVGYSTRNTKDTLSLMVKDFTVFTSTLDARLIRGTEALYLSFMDEFYRQTRFRKKEFIDNLLTEKYKRIKRYQDNEYLVEPNLKENIGGLRDVHYTFWISRVLDRPEGPTGIQPYPVLTDEHAKELRESQNYLLLVRNVLHVLAGRKEDRLTLPYQEQVAGFFNVTGNGTLNRVEQFLRVLYAHLERIAYLSDAALDTAASRVQPYRYTLDSKVATGLPQGLALENNRLSLTSLDDMEIGLGSVMDLFLESAKRKISISPDAQQAIRLALDRFSPQEMHSLPVQQMLLAVISSSDEEDKALEAMLNIGLLPRLMPEFDNISNLVQHDAFHIHPVDRHSLKSLEIIKKIEKGHYQKEAPILTDVTNRVTDRELLYMATLLHDIGKGQGQGHAEIGARIAPEILTRMGFARERIDKAVELIRLHLLLIGTALTRDLGEERTVETVVAKIKDIETLELLYPLSAADAMATGPQAWTSQKAYLLRSLFLKAARMLEKGELGDRDEIEYADHVKEQVRRLMITHRISQADLAMYLESMSTRYLSGNDPGTIIGHISLNEQLKAKDQVLRLSRRRCEEADCSELTVITWDRPGVFFRLAGIFTLNDLNIQELAIFTWLKDKAILVFQVTNPLDRLNEDAKWRQVEKDMVKSLQGNLGLEYRLAHKRKYVSQRNGIGARKPSSVRLDNDASEFFTVIEIATYDRMGLLYAIGRTFSEFMLNVRVAKISTKVDQVFDVFYVTNSNGEKIEDEELKKEINNALMFSITQV